MNLRGEDMKALEVAKFMLALTRDAGWVKMDLQTLQNMLYLAQGRALAQTGEPLFDDDIEATEHGPVIREVEEYFSRKAVEH